MSDQCHNTPPARDRQRLERVLFQVADFVNADTGQKLSYEEYKERIARTELRRNRGRSQW